MEFLHTMQREIAEGFTGGGQHKWLVQVDAQGIGQDAHCSHVIQFFQSSIWKVGWRAKSPQGETFEGRGDEQALVVVAKNT